MPRWSQTRDRFVDAAQFTWTHVVPDKWAWPRLAVGVSTYLLLVSAVLSVLAKGIAASRIADGAGLAGLPWTTAPDVAFFFGLATLFALGEAHSRWLYLITVPLTALACAVSMAAAGYLLIAGEQLNYEAVVYGFESVKVLFSIVLEQVLHGERWGLLIAIVVLTALPFSVDKLLAQAKIDRRGNEGARSRAKAAGLVALVGLAQMAVCAAPSQLARQRMGGNAVWRLYTTWLAAAPQSAEQVNDILATYHPTGLVDRSEINLLKGSKRPNVVLIVLESARFDHFALAGGPALATTPNVAALAQRGTTVPVTRAVMPHTTKSLFSLLCARLPIMHRTPAEVSALMSVQCLPAVLAEAGYRTAFLQSALGGFEHRPRLVDTLGFQSFRAWEDLQGQPLGYLGSDDQSLLSAFSSFSKPSGTNTPFFALLLSSATHHPYRLPDSAQRDAATLGKPVDTDAERYARLIEAQDKLIGDVVKVLTERNQLAETLIVVVGDHGEGFGDKGILQHDNNFFEEGLRVPFVLAGPGVPEGRSISGNASLIDVTPTILGRLGVRVAAHISAAQLAFDLFDASLAGVGRPFGCYYASRCRGIVIDHKKIVLIPEKQQGFVLDLKADPSESHALPLSGDLRERAAALDALITPYVVEVPLILGPIRDYGKWSCPPDKPCTHPSSPASGFFQAP